jgi:hypothetical protein
MENIMSRTSSIKPLTQRPAWKALAAHHKEVKGLHLRKLFADDPERGATDLQNRLSAKRRRPTKAKRQQGKD